MKHFTTLLLLILAVAVNAQEKIDLGPMVSAINNEQAQALEKAKFDKFFSDLKSQPVPEATIVEKDVKGQPGKKLQLIQIDTNSPATHYMVNGEKLSIDEIITRNACTTVSAINLDINTDLKIKELKPSDFKENTQTN